MKKFLAWFLVWMSIPLGSAYVVDYMVSSGLRKTDLRKYAVWNDIYGKKINADVVVIGSSRAWCGYNTYILDSLLHCNSYNLGIDGHNFEMQNIRYATYRRYNKKPRVVIVNADYVSTLGITADPRYEREQFFPYIWDDSLISAVKEMKEISFWDRFIPLLRYFGYRNELEDGISSFFGKTVFDDGGMYKGYRGNDYLWQSMELPKKEKQGVMSVVYDLKKADALDAFVRKACEEGIKVVLVKSPVCSSFYQLSDTHISDSVFERISYRYRVPILNYYTSDVSMDSTCFYNYSHLNRKGSELFTQELCIDLDSLGVIVNLK